jgi:protein-disulfide isomerase
VPRQKGGPDPGEKYVNDTTDAASTAPARAAASTSGRTAMLVALLCLVITIGLWWQLGSEVASLRDAQRQLATDVADLREVAIIDVTGAPALGAEDAVVTLIEYSDYECPFCVRHFSSTMPQIEETFIRTGQIRYVFRDFPIAQLHPGAARAHEAGRCAAEQGRFWEMHTRLFSAPGSHTDAVLESTAAAAGLELEAFRACLDSGRTRADVEQSVAMAASLGATGTPSFFLGIRDLATNQVEVLHGISGAQPFSVFEEAIKAIAARVR